MVACPGDHDCGHDGGNVEGGPVQHNLLEQFLGLDVLAYAGDPLLGRCSSGVVDGLRLVSVIVGLHEEPPLVGQLIGGMDALVLSLDDDPLVAADSRNDVVHWPSDFRLLETFDGSSVVLLFLENFPQQPDSWDGIVLQHTDKVPLDGVFLFAGVDIDREAALPLPGQGEDAACNMVDGEELLVSVIVVDADQHFGEDFPHFEVKVAAMHDVALVVADEHSGAGLDGGELVHEVEEK